MAGRRIGASANNIIGILIGFSSTVAESSVSLPLDSPSGNTGIKSNSGVVERTAITAMMGISNSATGTPLQVSQSLITTGDPTGSKPGIGISVDVGSVSIDDSMILLEGAGQRTGFQAANLNNGTSPLGIDARHLTIVANSSSGSVGVSVQANNVTTAGDDGEDATLTIADSIISGTGKSFDLRSDNGESVTATITYTNADFGAGFFTNPDIDGIGPTGMVSSNLSDNLSLDPGFFDAAGGNFHLAPESPLVDAGDPDPSGPFSDLDGADRVIDGDGDGVARRDLGAFELPDLIAPNTKITKKPAAKSSRRTVKFVYGTVTGEPGVHFQCRLDGKPFAACGASKRYRKLGIGRHRFQVRAIDAAGNADGSPARDSFRVVRKRRR